MAHILLYGVAPNTARSLKRDSHQLERTNVLNTQISCDLALVKMKGDAREWCIAMRKADASLPILAIVSDNSEADIAFTAGATDVIRKPMRGNILSNRVRLLVRLSKATNEVKDLELLVSNRRLSEASVDKTIPQNELLERLINSSPDPIVCSSNDGKIMVFNHAAEDLLAYSRHHVQRELQIEDIFADPGELKRVLFAITTSQQRRLEQHRTHLRSRSGEHIPILLSASEVTDKDNNVVAMILIFRDTRESDSLATRLRSATDRLINTEKRAAAVAIAGATAHELNQPLTSVMGIVELLLLTELNEKQTAKLDRAYAQLERMADIVRNLSWVTQYKTTEYVEGVSILDLTKTGPTNTDNDK